MDPAMMGGGMPMDPAMMGGGMPPGMPPGMPMDPNMMPPGQPPMDPNMMPPGMPMDPAMMQQGMPGEEDQGVTCKQLSMNLEQEIMSIKEMLQALMESQIAVMQTLSGGAMPPLGQPPMDPAMDQGMPMDPAMMGGAMPPGMPMDPAMMGGGMQVMASHTADKSAQDREFASYLKEISDLLR
jgi:hypothetical protein